jgi:uncharacterized protein (TIGR02594 family)
MLPSKYKFIEGLGVLPRIVSTSLNYIGIREIPGAKSNPIIMDMAKQIGVNGIYKNDDTSWCALFMCFVCKLADKPLPTYKGDMYDYLRAAFFLDYGNHVPKDQIKFGDIGVFARPGGNHVGIIVAESKTTYHVLGGNQSNSVNIAEIKKERLREARRYYKIAPPESAKTLPFIDSSGKVSTNEA